MSETARGASALSVLMFCANFFPRVGGAERQAGKLAAALVAKGCRVRVLTEHLEPDVPSDEVRHGFEIRRLPFFGVARPAWAGPLSGVMNVGRVALTLSRELRREMIGFDVLHVHLVGLLGAAVVRAASAVGTPVVCKIGSSGAGADFLRITGNSYVDRWVNHVYHAGVDRWIATTDAVRDSMLDARIPLDRIVKIPNGVDVLPARTSRSAIGARRFLCLGRLSRESDRDYDTLLSAFSRLAERHPEIELALVGGGNLSQSLRDAARRGGYSDRVHFPGECEPDGWYAWADCFVLPSRREGLSNALLEAMAAGVACIANDIPPNRETLAGGDAGQLVPVEGVDALASTMEELIVDPEMLERLGHAAWDRAKAFYAIESVAARHIDLYRACRDRKRRSIA